MSQARRSKKIAARPWPEFGPGFFNFLKKHLAAQDAQYAAGITNEQVLAMRKLDRRIKNHR